MSAFLRSYREDGPERSGLILFDAYAPHKPSEWGMFVSQSDKHALLKIGPLLPCTTSVIAETDLWVGCQDLRTIGHFLQVLMPGKEREAFDRLRRNEVRV